MKRNQKNQPNKYLVLTGAAFQMGAIIYLGNLLGEYLDRKYPNPDDLYTKFVTLAAVILAILSIIRQVNSLSKRE
ncbi:AtpZ/AtpI family protein [Mangrovimonas aestuarii]|uniref:AtpZ/AtpI family protein n=1 Tax=Mangrovimonas aestuarii TaxID=3018443 RepID=UPI0023780310|nr:AtpZ/AtpI family protein [Mangrovimonas aestuarii]